MATQNKFSPVSNNATGQVVAYQYYQVDTTTWRNTLVKTQAIPANNREDAEEWNAIPGAPQIPVPANSRYQSIAQQQVARPASVIAAETEAQRRAATETEARRLADIATKQRAIEEAEAAKQQEAARRAAELRAQQEAQAKAAADAEAKRQEAAAAEARRQQQLEAERQQQAAQEEERRAKEQAAQSQPPCCGLVAVGGPVTTPAALVDLKMVTGALTADDSVQVAAVADIPAPPETPAPPESSGFSPWLIVVGVLAFLAAIYLGFRR